MEPADNIQVNEVVVVKRNDHNGDRIPMEYRMYIADKTYIFKARIVQILDNKRYNRVQPLPLMANMPPLVFTRKAYKTKIYKLPL